MSTYQLHLETDRTANIVKLRLTDEAGAHCGSQQILLRDHPGSTWEGLFDTRRYVDRYAGSLRDADGHAKTDEELVTELGVFLGRHVLGREIMTELCRSCQHRTLLVRLPDTTDDVLAAAFARVPWELARMATDERPLMERALAIRVVTETTSAADSAVRRVAEAVASTEGVVRVLLVFAEAPGSRPLAMRLEREQLRKLFEEEILPHRNVELDVLCHGVTLAVLQDRITDSGGFHVIHWSGHGFHNQLELLGEDGGRARITGEALVELIRKAGGFVPQLVFLSSCLSGTLVEAKSWAELQAALRGDEKGGADSPPTERSLAEALDPENAPGYTGTALALLRSGVPQVVAMRYSVGDDYARELAWWFYKRLLADRGRPSTESALALARADVLQRGTPAARRTPVDHANPLVFGQEGRRLKPGDRRSKQMQRLRPRPQPLLPGKGNELERPGFFVGRGQALVKVNRAWQPGGAAVTVVQGMAGLGKTSLAAEAVHLWHERFDWVLGFQAKPEELAVEGFLRQVHQRLEVSSSAYQEKCEEAPYEAVYFEASRQLDGEARYERMCTNLVEALRDEAVLLVLDNFESNLQAVPSERGYACKDRHWDAVLRALSERLPGTRSRVLVTTRHRPRALASNGTEWLPLGPLPGDEAVLYVRSHEGLSTLLGDEAGRALVTKLLRVTRGHPLILDRLAALVGDRKALDEALGRLQNEGLGMLPELMVPLTKELVNAEREYLEEVAVVSVDLLLGRVSAGARRLLWVVTLAFEAVSEEMLVEVWAGRSPKDEMADRLRMLLAMREHLPKGLRAQLDAMPAELLEQLRAPSPSPVETAPVEPLLRELYQAGLVTREESLPSKGVDEAASATVVFHELVRERIAAWMDAHPDERGPRTAAQVWVGYGQRYAAVFESLHMSGKERAREASPEAGRRALGYLVRAGDFEGLRSFASMLVTGTVDPTLLGAIVAEFRTVAEQVPAGQARWSVRTYLADALNRSGRPDEALSLYEQAASEAEQAEHWSDVAWVCGNWANALGDVGQLDASKATHLRSAEAHRKGGDPRVVVVGREQEALRIDVMRGHVEQVLPDIEARLEEVRGWWKAQADGQPVPEAPDREDLGRVLVSSLDIARRANQVLKRWQECLSLIAEQERIKMARGESDHQLARTRFNMYFPLLRLGRLDAAQRVIQHCLAEFRKAGDTARESKALSALADLWGVRGDLRQASDLERQALAVRNHLPGPQERAISHAKLAHYLEGLGHPDAPPHCLAALAYQLVTGQREQMSEVLHNLAIARGWAAAVGTTYDLPRLANVLSQPAFEPLNRFLTSSRVDLPELQAAIDHLGAQATRAGAEWLSDLRALLAPIHEAAKQGQDVTLAELRSVLVDAHPEIENEIDAFLARIRSMLPTSSTPTA